MVDEETGQSEVEAGIEDAGAEEIESGAADDSFVVRTGDFEGPLNLLLGLIQDRKLYINEVSLAEVADDYIAFISRSDVELGDMAQFVLVASTLLLIKSRSLLPDLTLTDEEEESIEELERRLAEYRKIKEAAGILKQNWRRSPLVFLRQRPIERVHGFAPGESSPQSIHAAAAHMVAILPSAAFTETAHVAATVSLESMIESLQTRMRQLSKTTFKSITARAAREEIIVHFLALLELAKLGSISATQEQTFGDITLESDTIGTPQY